MDRELGEKRVLMMAGFTVAALVVAAAYGFTRSSRKKEKNISVSSRSTEAPIDLEERKMEEEEFLNIPSEIDENNEMEATTSNVPIPISLPPYGITDSDSDRDSENLGSSIDNKEKNPEMSIENLNASVKQLQEQMAKFKSQESDINELKKKVKEDEEKLQKLDSQAVEIDELKKQIREDENQIHEMQKELITLSEKHNKKKGNWMMNWPNRSSSIHDVGASQFGSAKKH